ncbi:MAG: lipopolysaccharide export system chaperone component LptA [Rhodobacteraceae bacterium HLUCCA08]|nr:MAG: lipopolysaccharide export system chaperone component LptA [Rhodobacteraceae bacterium HLUCCA08]
MRFLIAAFALLAATGPGLAQTDITLGGISADPGDPVEVSADSLSVDQDTGLAVFTGNVVVGQGDLRLSAGQVTVRYDEATGDITTLDISGGVTFVTATEEAEADSATYDISGGVLVLTGNVLLSQGASATSADRMRVDLESGAAQMDGNVRVIFNQGDQ